MRNAADTFLASGTLIIDIVHCIQREQP
jgi:hypothetical protein